MIENSPYHISNKRLKTVSAPKPTDTAKNLSNSKTPPRDSGKSSFWDWFRGLVNPLQNLPIISGIYSSINSDNSESDRDLVQNSLGGFIYGGPIGAIAGFGNWIFNKLFDKTPTEMAFDFTGVSNLWKDDEKDKDKVISQKENKDFDSSKTNQIVSSREWWNQNQFQLAGNSKSTYDLNKNEASLAQKKMLITTKVSNFDLDRISSKYENKNLEIEKKLGKNSSQNQLKVSNNERLVRSFQSLDKKTEITKIPTNISSNSINEKYRELNFDYPEWQPNDLEMSKKSSEKSKYLIFQEKHQDETYRESGKNINIKL